MSACDCETCVQATRAQTREAAELYWNVELLEKQAGGARQRCVGVHCGGALFSVAELVNNRCERCQPTERAVLRRIRRVTKRKGSMR